MDDIPVEVLLVEDNPQEAEIARLYLRKRYRRPYHVRHARTVAAAVDEIGATPPPDVILLDLHLPDAHGLDGYRRIAQTARSTPVIILTNFNDEATASQAVREGAQDYLVKREVNAALLHRAILYAIERQHGEQALIKVKERYALAATAANDCIWDWEAVDEAAYFSPRWNDLVGMNRDGAPATAMGDWFDRVHPEDIAELKQMMTPRPGKLRHAFENEHRLRRDDGKYVWVYARGVVIADAGGRPLRMAGSISSIAKRKETEHQLMHRALHDELTGLPNRALFTDRLQQALNRYRRDARLRFAVMYFDLDRFKVVNDSLGHSVGDSLLVSVAQRLRDVIRPGDTVGRLGGDEFAVLVSDLSDEAGLAKVAERIHRLFQQEFLVAGREMYTSASIGVAVASERYQTPEDMLRDADLAMYRAKRSEVEHTAVFDHSMHEAAVDRLNLEMDLRHAVERREFEVHYQPVVTLGERRIVGFEALLRWRHPQRGLVEPSAFLGVAEDNGLLAQLSWWVLEEACRQAREWGDLFGCEPRLQMGVNVPMGMFLTEDATQRVLAIVEANGLRPADLGLELTEKDCMEHEDAARRVLGELQARGVRIHMDDFGTGYSSLSYLNLCSFDTLKIDRSFIQGLQDQQNSQAIIRTIVGLGRVLGMNVVAEGVESKDQVDALLSMDCPEAQGYWFSRPVPPDEAGLLLRGAGRAH
jgi:diguanylate cyclase (GGDEF)-like protein/PAS domain S-box-containing protein